MGVVYYQMIHNCLYRYIYKCVFQKHHVKNKITMSTPFQQAQAILGEHYENYVIIVNEDSHGCEVEYNNAFASIGMLNWAKKTIDNYFEDVHSDENLEIDWDESETNDDDLTNEF
jgi:hypothetical protein